MLSLVAASGGSTISGLPLCHWPTRNWPFGLPSAFQLREPRIVSTELERSQSASLSWSALANVLLASTVACSTLAAAYASAASSGTWSPPNISWYFATNSGFPGVFDSWLWLVAYNTPSVFSAPTPLEYCSPNDGALVW